MQKFPNVLDLPPMLSLKFKSQFWQGIHNRSTKNGLSATTSDITKKKPKQVLIGSTPSNLRTQKRRHTIYWVG